MTEVSARSGAPIALRAGGEQGRGPGLRPTAAGSASARDYRGPGRLIGAWDPPDEVHPLSLHVTGPDSAELWRHRFNPQGGPSRAANVAHAEGEVLDVDWDDWHRAHAAPSWRDRLEGWIAAKIAADLVEQGPP